MGSLPSSPEKNGSGVSDFEDFNLKSIMKGKSPQHSQDLTAAVREKEIVSEQDRRISRRASIAPPQLDEEALNEILKKEVSENPALDNSVDNLVSEPADIDNDVLVNDSANSEIVAEPANYSLSENITIQDDAVNNCLETQNQTASSKEALLWAPVLASTESLPNTLPSHIQPENVVANHDIVSQLKKKATDFFKKEDDISIDAIIKNLLGHRGKKVQRRAIQIPKSQIEWVCRSCLEVLMNQPILLEITGPVNVCGKFFV